MTEQEMLEEIRSLRTDVGALGDQVLNLRYDDLKGLFLHQVRVAMGEEGRRSVREEAVMLQTSSACNRKAECLARLEMTMDVAAEHFLHGDMERANKALDDLEGLVMGEGSPCLDEHCSREAAETLRRVKTILAIYEYLADRLGNAPGPSALERGEVTPDLTEAVLGPLANSWRIKVMRFLRQGERGLTEIAKAVELRTGHLQFHLRALIAAGYVRADRRRHLYGLTPRGQEALHGAEELVSRLGSLPKVPEPSR